jgi:hypothetical protein
MGNWRGCCSTVERWRQGNDFTIQTLLFERAQSRKVSKFLQDEIPLTLLDKLRTDPKDQFHREVIDQIAVRLDISDVSNTTNENTHLLCSKALRSFSALVSTQHNNEQLVKLGALVLLTGESEIMASIFAIASNDFMTEHHDAKENNTQLEVPANQPAVAEDEPKWQKRGNY